MRGSRVQSVSNELAGERIDIIPWDEDPAKFVINAMSPAEVLSIVVDETSKTMDIAVAEEQLSQAIGRGGQNVRLASELTGWNLNVMSKEEADDKNMREEEETAAEFQQSLNVDNDVAKILAEEGFSSIDEIALCELEELEEINGFDKDLVIELRKRAIDAYDKQQKELDNKNSLTNLNDLNDDHIALLKNNDILTINDIADLSIDELLDIIEISSETAGKIIMQARESWFEEKMTEKDNIKLKTDTLTSRKNNSPVGVHVKRKRKIITQTSTAQSDPSSKITKTDSKKEIIKDSASQNIKTTTKLSQTVENQTSDLKASKKHKIDKDEKIERMENKELHLKSPSSKKGKNKKIKLNFMIFKLHINSRSQQNL